MDAALHVLRYRDLRVTYDQAILYQHVDVLVDTLRGWVDSDWAADVDSRRSHTGYIIMLNGGAVSWKRQDCESLSTEAECVEVSQCGQEVSRLHARDARDHDPPLIRICSGAGSTAALDRSGVCVACVLLLQDLLQSCSRGGGGECVFYYCRTYYKAVRVGGEESGGHVL